MKTEVRETLEWEKKLGIFIQKNNVCTLVGILAAWGSNLGRPDPG